MQYPDKYIINKQFQSVNLFLSRKMTGKFEKQISNESVERKNKTKQCNAKELQLDTELNGVQQILEIYITI